MARDGEREREVDLPLYCYSRQPSELRGKDAHVQSSLRWTVLPVVLLYHHHHYCPSAPLPPLPPGAQWNYSSDRSKSPFHSRAPG